MNLWRDKTFDLLRNLPAILKCVVFITTSPGLPYHVFSVRGMPEQSVYEQRDVSTRCVFLQLLMPVRLQWSKLPRYSRCNTFRFALIQARNSVYTPGI